MANRQLGFVQNNDSNSDLDNTDNDIVSDNEIIIILLKNQNSLLVYICQTLLFILGIMALILMSISIYIITMSII